MTSKKQTGLKGNLEAFFETGTEGVIWSFQKDADPQVWAKMFLDGKPAELVKKPAKPQI